MTAPRMTKTGGMRAGEQWPGYFIAGNMKDLQTVTGLHPNILVAVNEIHGSKDAEIVRAFAERGTRVLIDSGVFSLASAHASKHNLSISEAISMPPEQVEGFGQLFDAYCDLLAVLGDKVWGYIELDLGGREAKIRTRARLEARGLRPMPVWHPLVDGWDYFDYLAQRYDRIAMGNLVGANGATRKRLVATAWHRRRRYPHLWIHALGVTASEVTNAFPLNSCDSSTWLSGVRWGYLRAWSANRRLWDAGDGFNYDMDADAKAPRGHTKAVMLGAYDAHMQSETMRIIAAEQRDVIGCDIGLFTEEP